MKEIIKRLKSPVVWSSIIAQVLVIIGLYCPDIADPVKITATAVVEILTLAGILNNPTDCSKF